MSFLLPVCNGGFLLERVIDAILAQRDGRPFELIVVDDRSEDGSRELLERRRASDPLTLLDGEGRGAAAALNLGVAAACQPLLCQVDQDVVLLEGWLEAMDEAMVEPGVAAACGRYVNPPGASLWARIAGLDLDDRYQRLGGAEIEHVASGNSVYRLAALRRVGGFDETLGYAYDNDLSYRLRNAGHRLRVCLEARSEHHWRSTLLGYLRQQYGVGYGRLDLLTRHPRRLSGDTTSGGDMVIHAALAGAAVLCGLFALAGRPPRAASAAGATAAALAITLATERGVAGARAYLRSADPAALAFPIAHLLRDGAWVAATAAWTARRLVGRPALPTHSMRRQRPAGERSNGEAT